MGKYQSGHQKRFVKVDRQRSIQDALDATGREQSLDEASVKSMPFGEGVEMEITFFKLDLTLSGNRISDQDLEAEYDLLDLKPDPVAQLAMNEADPDFAKEYPNATHWIDGHGKWHFMTIEFDSLSGRRLVNVFPRQQGSKWPSEWWFGGVPK